MATRAVATVTTSSADDNRDGQINYQEFTKVLTAEDIMHIPAPRSGVNTSQMWGKDGR